MLQVSVHLYNYKMKEKTDHMIICQVNTHTHTRAHVYNRVLLLLSRFFKDIDDNYVVKL